MIPGFSRAIVSQPLLPGVKLAAFQRTVLLGYSNPARRHSDDGERHSIYTDCGTQNSPVACKKLLPKSIADNRDCVTPRCVVSCAECSSKHRLRAEKREEIPGSLCNVRPHHVLCAPKVKVDLLKERGVGKIGAVLPPIVKLFCAIVGQKICLQ